MDEEKPSRNILGEVILISLVIAIIGGISGLYFGGIFDQYRDVLTAIYAFGGSIRRTTEIISIMLSFGLIGFIISVLQKFFSLRERAKKDLLPARDTGTAHTVPLEKEAAANWEEIKALADSGNPSDWNMAVLRADALLEDILTHRGYQGVTLAETLKVVDPGAIPSIDRLWSAHRLRNMIAHEPMQQHTKETIDHALRSYESALKDLKVLGEEKLQ